MEHCLTLFELEDEKQRILSERYTEEIVKNTHLTEENSTLKRRLEKLDGKASISGVNNATETGNAPPPNVRSSIEEGASVSREDYHELVEKFRELRKSHQTAIQRMKYLEKKNVAVMQKNKEMKESVRAWQDYSDRHHAKKQKLKAQAKNTLDLPKPIGPIEDYTLPAMPLSPGSSVFRTSPPVVGLDKSSPAPFGRHLHNGFPILNENAIITPRSSAAEHNTDVGPVRGGEDETHYYHDQLPEVIENVPQDMDVANVDETANLLGGRVDSDGPLPSSQRTEDEVAQDLTTLMPPPASMYDDDVPQVVSERSLKRKRATRSPVKVYTDRLPSDGTPVNPFRVKEEPHSSPPRQLLSPKLLRKETLDLDEPGPNALSTPHRRRLRGGFDLSTGRPTLRHQRSISEPRVKEEAHMVGHDPMTSDARANSEPMEQAPDGPGPLQTLDPNTRMAGRGHDQLPSKRTKLTGKALGFQLLTESGEAAPPLDTDDARLAPEEARERFNKRLKAAKDMRTPMKNSAKTPATGRSKLQAVQFPTPPASTTRATDTPSTRPGSRKGKGAQLESPSVGQTSAPANSRPIWPRTGEVRRPRPQDQIPLRSKPVNELMLTDFKANPKFNHGYTFAFDEVVRNHAERACLLGCTRPECCGSDFRTLAAVAAPLSPEEEKKLLQDHLGDAYDAMQLAEMSSTERKELVLQARTRQLSNKHGKHRMAYERHTTPPGYWNVDFPSTQEQADDKRKADVMKRKMIEERRAEALRKGGRWMFKDE